MENTSGFSLGQRVKLVKTPACALSDDLVGSLGTVIDFASREKYPWLYLLEKDIGKAIVELDNGTRCGEFSEHREQRGCILARKSYNSEPALDNELLINMEDII